MKKIEYKYAKLLNCHRPNFNNHERKAVSLQLITYRSIRKSLSIFRNIINYRNQI